ncbi:MAG TPA: DUF58 domain-containing protein [Methylococcaceae bacterium]|nr:DUF58 domain-containing protein [Methylococcaceae bacterium]
MPHAPLLSSPYTSVTLKTLVDLAQPASGLSCHHQRIKARQSGGYISRFKGRGMEFDETRLYQRGDDIRSIDWRVTARTGKTHTKIFREERERPVFISVDLRETMHFASRGVFKSVMAAKLAALLAWAAHHRGDRCGGQLFFDTHCLELKPQNGKQAVLHFLHLLATATHSNPLPEKNNADTHTLESVLSRLLAHAKPSSLLYLISDFRGLTPHAQIQLSKLAAHCEVVLLCIYDSLEANLPRAGHYPFTQNAQYITISNAQRAQFDTYQQHFLQKQQQLQTLAKQRGMIFIPISTHMDPLTCLKM